MMKPLYIGAFVVTVMLTYGLYTMKHEVQRLESKLQSLHRQLASEREAVRILRAEWSFLNNPERIGKLTARHLDLTPVSVHRISAMARLPFKEVSDRADISDHAAQTSSAKLSTRPTRAPEGASR